MTPLAIALIVLVAMFLLGLPIFMSLIISSVVAILAGGDILPLSVIHNSLFDGLNLFPLLAIPCFVVAGTLMEFGNITQQIVDVVKQLVGRVYGGLGITTILACTFFAAISGSGPGTVAAVGTILVPAMVRNGYSKDYASAAASSGGTIGILIPPSNPMIIYAILGNLSVTAMFTAGFIPGFIVAFAMIMTAYLLAKRNGFKGDENAAPFNMKFFLRSCGNAGFALATPFIILGSIYTGWATPVEASVVAIVWALFVGIVINRVLRPRHIYRALLEGAMTCGAVLLMVIQPGTKADINKMVMTWLPYFAFIMYLINRGTGFTQALFMNCDHSLLTYSFYKRPGFVLRLFRIRLREIIKVNAVPALVIGCGLALILYVSGGTDNPLNYVVLVVTILAMSAFFSIHYLTVYYLLQPYTAGTELKSGTYRIVMVLTYVVCYAMINVRMPILMFGAMCIAFCVAYSIVASILVYKFAPRTFRLRT